MSCKVSRSIKLLSFPEITSMADKIVAGPSKYSSFTASPSCLARLALHANGDCKENGVTNVPVGYKYGFDATENQL
jgi:hypothetical protein